MPIDRSVGAAYADRIITLYVEVERELAELIAGKLKRGIAHDDLTQKMLALSEIRRSAEAAMRKIDGKTGPAVELALREAAAAGGRKAQEELLRVRDRRAVGRRLADVDKNLVNSPSILRLAASLAPGLESRLAATHLQVVRSAGDIYQHAVAAMSVPGVLAGVSTRREATQKALDHLWRKGITGFVDKAGRNWNLAGYVEMATRTTTAHAAIQAHLDQLGQQGMDLVMVSADGAPCPICRPWEGKILTTGTGTGSQVVERTSELDGSAVKVHIDGSTAQAIGAGLFHPSCRHRFVTYLPGLSTPIETAGEGGSLYDAEQRQRGLERQARRLAVQQTGAVDPDAAKRYAAAYRAKRAEIAQHVKDTPGLRRKTERERIDLGHAPSAAPAPTSAPRKATPAPTGPKSIRKPGTDQEKWIKDFANLNAVADSKARTKQGDGALDAIGERQGFKAKPQNVTKSQLDEAVRHGWVETWRGVHPGLAEFEVTLSSRQINDQLRHGDFFPGLGIYGNGTYLSVHRGVAEVYAGVREEMAEPGGYMRLAVDPRARIIDHSDLIAERDAWVAAQGPYMDSVLKRIVADEGRYAAIRGYDVIRVVDKEDGSDLTDEKDRYYDQYIILNRSVIMIQDTDPT